MQKFKVVQVDKKGFVKGVWHQEAASAKEALESVKNYYANLAKGDKLEVA